MGNHRNAAERIEHLAQMTLLGVCLKTQSHDPFTLSAECDRLLAYAAEKGTLATHDVEATRTAVRDEIATLYGQLLADHP